MSYPGVPGAPGAPVPPKKKSNLLVWVLVGLVGFVVLVGILVAAAGYFMVKKVAKEGPAFAVTRMVAALNPDLEVVEADEAKGVIVVRNTRENKIYRLNLEDVKKGRIVFQEEGKEAVTVDVTKEGGQGAVEVHGPEGTMRMGAGADKPPDWVPAYPGATGEAQFSMRGAQGDSGSFSFLTKDPADQVARWFDAEFQKVNWKSSSNIMHQGGKTTGATVTAEDEKTGRGVIVTVSAEQEGTRVGVVYNAKP